MKTKMYISPKTESIETLADTIMVIDKGSASVDGGVMPPQPAPVRNTSILGNLKKLGAIGSAK